MPRVGDLQLLAAAVLAGAAVGWLGARESRRGRIGASAVVAALLVAWVLDRWLVDAVPRDPVEGRWSWAAAALVGVVVGRGAGRLPVRSSLGVPPVVALALASLAGIWVGVPETSAALLVAGVIVGLTAALHLGGLTLERGGAVAVGLAPVVAAVAGSAGEGHALLGGVLCSATLGFLALGPQIATVGDRPLVVATALQLVGALIAGRQVGVARGDAGVRVAIATAVVVGIAAVAARVLRGGQARRGP